MLTVTVDEQYVHEEIAKQIKEAIEANNQQLVFWDTKELQRRTNMSWNFIQEKFFFDKDFPKYRVGSKWIFPAKECEEFLLKWVRTLPRC